MNDQIMDYSWLKEKIQKIKKIDLADKDAAYILAALDDLVKLIVTDDDFRRAKFLMLESPKFSPYS